MDPLSIAAGIIGILQATKSCLKVFRKLVGPSHFGSAELDSMRNSLYEFHGILKTFQTHLDIYEDDEDYITSLEHLKSMMVECEAAVQMIKGHLQNSGFIDRALKGAKFDKKLKFSLKTVEESGKLFKIAVLSDQQSILLGVKKYMEDMGQAMQVVKTEQESIRAENEINSIREWLNTQSDNDINRQRHRNNVSKRHHGSGQWLVEHPFFLDWISNRRSRSASNLWLKGSPGAGKSYVCSAAINHIAQQQQLCLYYFCRFDDRSGRSTSGHDATSGFRTAAILINQLFRHFWQNNPHVANSVASFIKAADKDIAALRDIALIILKEAANPPQNQPGSSNAPFKLYLFLDGLDEERHLSWFEEVTGLFHSLEADVPVDVRIWISSRDGLVVRNQLNSFSIINLDDYAEQDVHSYLLSSVSQLKHFHNESANINGIPLMDWVLQNLKQRAKSNFLYAELTIERLRNGVFNIEDIISLVTSSVPDRFTDIYERILGRYHRDQRKYVSLLLSFVTFARRPLYLKEIEEAMTLALSHPSKGLDPWRAPLSLQDLFAPLIEMQQNPQDPKNPLCHLCHATVQEFLLSNPKVLGDNFEISPAIFGDICLRYLSQQRYSSLIRDSRTGKPGLTRDSLSVWEQGGIYEHALLPYCAKFWNKHLEDVQDTADHVKAVCDFLESPNFQTLLQIQSLTVAKHFELFHLSNEVQGEYLIAHRQALPWWLNKTIAHGHEGDLQRYQRGYRHFVDEWGYLLNASFCTAEDPSQCQGDHFLGQIDRCLSGLLGSNSFMRNMVERYPSFMLSRSGLDYTKKGVFPLSEGLSLQQDFFTLVSSNLSDISVINVEHWKLRDLAGPKIASTTSIDATGVADASPETKHQVHLSQGMTYLRIKNWLVSTGESDGFLHIPGVGPGDGSFSPHTEDFERRGNIVVITKRTKKHELRAKSKALASLGEKRPEDSLQAASIIDSADDSDDNDESDESELSSASSEYQSAEETCSEGSTEMETDEDYDDSASPDTLSEASDISEDLRADDSSGSDDEASDDTDKNKRLDISLTHQQLADDDDNLDLEGNSSKQSRERPRFRGAGRRTKARKDQLSASISIFSVIGTRITRVFHYKGEIPYLLYHSGPIIHPYKPMVIWPLAGGQVLFADYATNSFFIRGSMASTRDSRHISMKCHLSDCGKYLHFASLEGRILSVDSGQRRDEGKLATKRREHEKYKGSSTLDQTIVISLFVTTHRLSERKTTRSPPHLLHKVRIVVGKFAGLSLEKLPFTFTWTSNYVYFSITGHRLNVLRIRLFAGGAGEPMVTSPRLPVMLPRSANGRQIHYLPPKDGDERGLVLMGSYPGDSSTRIQLKPLWGTTRPEFSDTFMPQYHSPPVGFYVHEEQDLGGWGVSETEKPVERGEKYRDGRLVWKNENFRFEDDIDLEGICEQCKGPIYFSTS